MVSRASRARRSRLTASSPRWRVSRAVAGPGCEPVPNTFLAIFLASSPARSSSATHFDMAIMARRSPATGARPRDQQELLAVDTLVVGVYVVLALHDALRGLFVPVGVGARSFADLVEHQAAHLDDADVQGGQRTVESLGDMAFEKGTIWGQRRRPPVVVSRIDQ